MSNPHIALVLAAALLLVPFTAIASADCLHRGGLDRHAAI